MRTQFSSFDWTRAGLARTLPGAAHNPQTALRSALGEALDEIRDLASRERIAYTPRAHSQLSGVLPTDVRYALRTANSCERRDHSRWQVVGTGLSGERVSAVVAVADGVLIVTAIQGATP